MAPKTDSYDNVAFDNLFSSSISASSPITTGKSTTTMGFWDGGPAYRSNKNIMMSTNENKTEQATTSCYFDKHSNDIPNAVTMDTTIAPSFSEAPTTPDWEDELHSFTFRRMNSPCSSTSSSLSQGVKDERIFDFDNTSFNQTFMYDITSIKLGPYTTAIAVSPSIPKKSMIESINQRDKERITTETAAISDGTTIKKENVGAALHPSWSDEFLVVSAPPITSSQKEEDDDETYQSGLKGDHGQRPIGGLAAGYTNAVFAMNDGHTQTKLPICWHKELDPEKQQAKIQRARQKMAQTKQEKSQRNKCQGWRAIFGNPKAICKSEPKAENASTMNKRHKRQPQEKNVMTVQTKSTAKDPLKLLFGNPKPLKKRSATATSRSMFV